MFHASRFNDATKVQHFPIKFYISKKYTNKLLILLRKSSSTKQNLAYPFYENEYISHS